MARHLELTPRLSVLARWVPDGAHLADVGTDHGYLPVWLMLHGRIASAIASDLRPGPLERARSSARAYGVEGIDFRLCDGLSGIGPEEADTVVIAGMGGERIAAILAAAPWTADGAHTLLLQPQTRARELRLFLAGHGYEISREALVRERGTLRPAMEVRAGEMPLTLAQSYCGAKLLRDPLGERYIIEETVRLQMAAAGLERAGPAGRERADALRDAVEALLRMREEWLDVNGL